MKVSEIIEKRRAELEAMKADLATRAESLEDPAELEKVKEELRSVINDLNDIMNAEPEEREAEPEDSEKRDITPEERNFKPLATYGLASEERKDNKEMENIEYRTAFLNYLMGKATPEERALIGNSSAVMPVETANKIYGKLAENKLFAELAPTYFKGAVRIPTAATVNDASWVAMSAAVTESGDIVTAIQLGAKKLIKVIDVPADMEYVSVDAFESWIVEQLSNKMLTAICYAVIRGTGGTMATGIVGNASSVASGFTYADLLKVMGSVKGQYHDGAVWVCSSVTFFNDILGLVDSTGRPLVQQGVIGIDGAPSYVLLGHRVILDDNADTQTNQDIIFGNFKEGYAFNFADGIKISRDESTGFKTGSVSYRAMALCDGAIIDTNAFAVAEV